LAVAPEVEVTKQGYLGAVVDDLQVVVEKEPGLRRISVLGRVVRALRLG